MYVKFPKIQIRWKVRTFNFKFEIYLPLKLQIKCKCKKTTNEKFFEKEINFKLGDHKFSRHGKKKRRRLEFSKIR